MQRICGSASVQARPLLAVKPSPLVLPVMAISLSFLLFESAALRRIGEKEREEWKEGKRDR